MKSGIARAKDLDGNDQVSFFVTYTFPELKGRYIAEKKGIPDLEKEAAKEITKQVAFFQKNPTGNAPTE